MHVAIVYESLFGNTREIAEAIGEGVRSAHPDAEIDCLRVDEAAPERLGAVDLLVVGGPTHMHGMTSGFSRKMGVESEQKKLAQGEPGHEPEPGAEGPGVRTWFHTLPKAPGHHPHAAAFDTRAAFPTSGGAAHGIARRLRRHGYEMVADPTGFVVEGADGPLRAGELDRARAWGSALAADGSHD